MKYVVISLLLFVGNAFSGDFSGCWKYENASSSYQLSLNEDGGRLSGNYCFINSGGNRIDCDKSASVIDGEIKNNVGIISFGGSGRGDLFYESNRLILKMVDSRPFDDFNMHIPNEINLSKFGSCKVPN